jgi:hypothetical protein
MGARTAWAQEKATPTHLHLHKLRHRADNSYDLHMDAGRVARSTQPPIRSIQPHPTSRPVQFFGTSAPLSNLTARKPQKTSAIFKSPTQPTDRRYLPTGIQSHHLKPEYVKPQSASRVGFQRATAMALAPAAGPRIPSARCREAAHG